MTVLAELAKRKVNPKHRVGFYGCQFARGRLVRVGLIGTGHAPRTARVECPHCLETHFASITWRAPIESDKGREPEVRVRVR